MVTTMESSSIQLNGFQRIVLPIDFSTSADRALPRTLALAERVGAEVDLLHVLISDGDCEDPALFHRIAQARSRLDAIRLAYRWQVSGRSRVVIHTHVACAATAAEGIQTHVRRHHAGLIVMATHGWNGHADGQTGGVTRQILHAPPCPVLTVPAQRPTTGIIQRVHVAFGDAPRDRAALRLAAALTAAFSGTLLVYVPAPQLVPAGAADVARRPGDWTPPPAVMGTVAALLLQAEVIYRPVAPDAGGIPPEDVYDTDLAVVPSSERDALVPLNACSVLALG